MEMDTILSLPPSLSHTHTLLCHSYQFKVLALNSDFHLVVHHISIFLRPHATSMYRTHDLTISKQLTQLSQLWPELYNKDPEFGVSNSNSGGMFLDFHGLNSDERAAVKNEI